MTTTITTLNNQCNDAQKRFTSLETLFGQFRGYVNGQFGSIQERLTVIEETMTTKTDIFQLEQRIDKRLESLEQRIDARFEAFEHQIKAIITQALATSQ